MNGPGQRACHRAFLRFALGAASLALFLVIGCRSLDFGIGSSPRITPQGDLSTTTQATAPKDFVERVAPYVFFSDFDLKKEKGLLDDLTQLRDRVGKQLQLPLSTAIIQVYLFSDRERYVAHLKQKNSTLPTSRRALFIAEGRGPLRKDLLVFTYKTNRLVQDLRHELTHALLHSVLLQVPLWLDEGLAEYFELPPDLKGVNADHLRLLLHEANGPVKPDLARLETLTEVPQMQPAEYREAWGWVHLMLHGKPEARKVLLAYLAANKETKTPGQLGPRLAEVYPALNEAYLSHLAEVERAAGLTRRPR